MPIWINYVLALAVPPLIAFKKRQQFRNMWQGAATRKGLDPEQVGRALDRDRGILLCDIAFAVLLDVLFLAMIVLGLSPEPPLIAVVTMVVGGFIAAVTFNLVLAARLARRLGLRP